MAIANIIKGINKVISLARKPLNAIPAILITCGAITRPGMSAMMLASNIIRRFSEAGAYTGPLSDGSQNVMEALERIRAEEYIKMIKNDMRIDVGIPQGAIQILNADGSIGVNINPVGGTGIAR